VFLKTYQKYAYDVKVRMIIVQTIFDSSSLTVGDTFFISSIIVP
jgi:hypothetical protein